MEFYAKNKEYEKANEVKIRIIKECSEQENKWKTEEYDRKVNNEKNKLKLRHSKEIEKLKMKIKRAMDEFKEVHIEELDNLELRYKNKLHIANYEHTTNENSFKKPSKYQIIKKVGVQDQYIIVKGFRDLLFNK